MLIRDTVEAKLRGLNDYQYQTYKGIRNLILEAPRPSVEGNWFTKKLNSFKVDPNNLVIERKGGLNELVNWLWYLRSSISVKGVKLVDYYQGLMKIQLHITLMESTLAGNALIVSGKPYQKVLIDKVVTALWYKDGEDLYYDLATDSYSWTYNNTNFKVNKDSLVIKLGDKVSKVTTNNWLNTTYLSLLYFNCRRGL